MRNKKAFLLIVFILPGVLTLAQEYYDLNRCITAGLERNFSILIARNEQEIAKNNYSPGNAGFLPTLDVSGRYGGTLNNTRQEYFSGKDTSMTGIHNTSSTAGVSLGWTIFRGFNAQTSYKRLNELKQIGELNTQMSVENFVAEITSEYYFYIQQIQLYRNLAYAVSLSRERVRIDEERYLLGASSKLQLLQSQVYLNTDSSRYAKQKEVLRAAQIRINTLMAAENPGDQFIPKDTVIVLNTGLVYDSLFAATEGANTSLLIARKNKILSEYDYKMIASQTYPYLDLTSAYNYNYNKYESGSFRNQQTDGLSYGLTLGVNLFDGFNQRRQKANARIAIDNQGYQYQQVEQQVKADLITIYYSYENNLLLLKLEQQNLKTAEENLDIALERYKLGSLSGLELREVQQSLLEAEERLLSVQYQVKLAEISLMQISGKVMEYIR
jgi:outer membrane protein TolC